MIKKSLLLLLLLVLTGAPARAQVTAIKAGKLIDPEAGTTALNQVVLIENRKIKAISPSSPIPAGAIVVDLSNSTVLPGLFDAQTHFCITK